MADATANGLPSMLHPVAAGSVPVPIPASAEGPPQWDYWMHPDGRFVQWKDGFLMTPPRWILWIVRALPAPRFKVVLVGRHDEVLEVLGRSDVFGVGFADEIARLNDGRSPGTGFLLGFDDRERHDAQLQNVMRAFPRADIARVVVPLAAQHAERCMREATAPRGAGRAREPAQFDAIGALITRVALHLCADYFGVPLGENPTKFAYATFTTSGHLFGKPPIVPDAEADRAAAYFRYFVEQAITQETRMASPGRTVVARLVKEYRRTDGTLSDEDFAQVRAFLMGMIVAFIPNNTLAGGHILDVLLEQPAALEQAQAAVAAGNDDKLESVLFEALRFKPLNPGPFRVCRRDHVLAEGTPYARRIERGRVVWALSFAAMFDPLRVEAPRAFDPTRPKSDQLHFGHGMHTCAGLMIARAHLTQTFKALLRGRHGLRRVPGTRTRLRGGMPVETRIFPGELADGRAPRQP